MYDLYSMTKNQAAIIALIPAMQDTTGNLPSLPSILPDYMAPCDSLGPAVPPDILRGAILLSFSRCVAKFRFQASLDGARPPTPATSRYFSAARSRAWFERLPNRNITRTQTGP
jgi:hypothetical protein